MIYHLDADLNGLDSVKFLYEAGLVKHIPCGTYDVFDQAMQWLLRSAVPGQDTVVVDTISQLAFLTQGDAKLGNDPFENLWNKRDLFLDGDRNYLNVYNVSGYFIVRRLKNLAARGVQIIITCHEGDQTDQFIKKKAPSLNKALYERVKEITSDICRLWTITQPVLQPGTQDILYPAGTRAIQIKADAVAVAKYHMSPFITDQVPPHIPIPKATDPVLPILARITGKLPSTLCLYGEPGVGKTTAALSQALLVFLQLHYPHLVPEQLRGA